MKRFPRQSAVLLLAGAAVAAAALWVATAGGPQGQSSAPPSDSALAAMARAGLIVAIDPETGELGSPNAEQLAALRAKSGGSEDPMEGLLEIRHPDGSVSVRDLSGRFLQFEIVRVGPDGSLQAGCAQGPEQAAAQMRDTAARPAGALEVK